MHINIMNIFKKMLKKTKKPMAMANKGKISTLYIICPEKYIIFMNVLLFFFLP